MISQIKNDRKFEFTSILVNNKTILSIIIIILKPKNIKIY